MHPLPPHAPTAALRPLRPPPAVNDVVPLWAAKTGPFTNPSETYEYYSLPYCKPKDGVKWKTLGMGEVRCVRVWECVCVFVCDCTCVCQCVQACGCIAGQGGLFEGTLGMGEVGS